MVYERCNDYNVLNFEDYTLNASSAQPDTGTGEPLFGSALFWLVPKCVFYFVISILAKSLPYFPPSCPFCLSLAFRFFPSSPHFHAPLGDRADEEDEEDDEEEEDKEGEQEGENDEDKKKKKPYIMDPDHRLFLRVLLPLLHSRNSGVVMAVVQAYHYLAPHGEVPQVSAKSH